MTGDKNIIHTASYHENEIYINVIIFFKITIKFFVSPLINFEGWFHPVNMQMGQNKNLRFFFIFRPSKTYLSKNQNNRTQTPENLSLLVEPKESKQQFILISTQ